MRPSFGLEPKIAALCFFRQKIEEMIHGKSFRDRHNQVA